MKANVEMGPDDTNTGNRKQTEGGRESCGSRQSCQGYRMYLRETCTKKKSLIWRVGDGW